jgi:hypothetical protein
VSTNCVRNNRNQAALLYARKSRHRAAGGGLLGGRVTVEAARRAQAVVDKQVCELVRAPLSAADVDTMVSTLCTSLVSALDGAPPNQSRGQARVQICR